MRVLIQRVAWARVQVAGHTVAEIGPGLLLLVGVTHGDGEAEADTGGEALVVSQFTLYADARKGRRPAFVDAARPEVAEPLVERFAALLQAEGVPTQTGRFGAHMHVELCNDGPVTIWLDRPPQGGVR